MALFVFRAERPGAFGGLLAGQHRRDHLLPFRGTNSPVPDRGAESNDGCSAACLGTRRRCTDLKREGEQKRYRQERLSRACYCRATNNRVSL
jgi:hypothetical protein